MTYLHISNMHMQHAASAPLQFCALHCSILWKCSTNETQWQYFTQFLSLILCNIAIVLLLDTCNQSTLAYYCSMIFWQWQSSSLFTADFIKLKLYRKRVGSLTFVSKNYVKILVHNKNEIKTFHNYIFTIHVLKDFCVKTQNFYIKSYLLSFELYS